METRTVSVGGPAVKGPTGCLDGGECGDACFERGEPQQVWAYVGPGFGQYDKVERYAPVVGGSWKIEQVDNGRVKWGSCCGWLFCLTAMAGVVFLVVAYRGLLTQLVSQDVKVVSETVNQPPLFNCSRGSWTTSLKAQIDQATEVYRNSLYEQSDSNFDGILSAAELQSSSSKLPSCFAQQLFQWDQDGNGLTIHELNAGLQVKDMVDAEAEKTFAMADSDCDGSLSLSELQKLRSEASLPSYTTQLLGSADVDADDKLSKLEFVAAMRKSGVAPSTGAGTGMGEVWNETKRQWCCSYQSIGCETFVTDIHENADCSFGAVELWSEAKSQHCCQMEGRGCLKRSAGLFDCLQDDPEAWTFKQRDYCCAHSGRGCHRTHESYDCLAGLDTWKAGWSLHKKLWCCDNQKLGCATEQYSCLNSVETWTADQQVYCCQAHKVGCPEDKVEVKEPEKTETATAPAPPKAEQPLFDCRTGWPDHVHAWGDSKKEFCCSNYKRGCKDSKEEPEEPAAPLHPAPHVVIQTNLFNCQDDLVNWHSWAAHKKSWCCQHQDIACAEHGQYDCDAGQEKSWKSEKKDYCCLYQKKGCEFDEDDAEVEEGDTSESYDSVAASHLHIPAAHVATVSHTFPTFNSISSGHVASVSNIIPPGAITSGEVPSSNIIPSGFTSGGHITTVSNSIPTADAFSGGHVTTVSHSIPTADAISSGHVTTVSHSGAHVTTVSHSIPTADTISGGHVTTVSHSIPASSVTIHSVGTKVHSVTSHIPDHVVHSSMEVH
ncbi:unnamed protein product [Durusdinium trenchii]|uniref:EF-hand domain-containing protein n=1 Tax=Durusdinium trenchii TaxID=1381693 RepID=A0ABP0H627_9DINO